MEIDTNLMGIIASASKRMGDRIAKLERQNAAYRKALEEIDEILRGDLPVTRAAKRIARAALEDNHA